MADVEGGLLKCVLQLAACSDKVRPPPQLADSAAQELSNAGSLAFSAGVGPWKRRSFLTDRVCGACLANRQLRLADARLGKYVDGMKRDLPASELPSLVRAWLSTVS